MESIEIIISIIIIGIGSSGSMLTVIFTLRSVI